MSASLRLAWALFSRDLRSGRLNVLLLALSVSMAAMATVGLFTDRIRLALTYQAAELIGGDLLIESAHALPEALSQSAQRAGLESVTLLEMPTVVLAGERTQMASLKAVGTGYPLKGRLRVRAQPGAADEAVDHGPARGEAWVEPRLLYALDLQLGDSLEIGAQRFDVTRLITLESDRALSFAAMAPRVMIPLADIEATGLVHPASRLRHKRLIAGPIESIERWRRSLSPELLAEGRLRTPHNARPQLRNLLTRAERFLGLAALIAVLLGGAAVAMTARHFALHHADHSALMRCLGTTRAQVTRIFLLELCAALGLALLLGSAVGLGGQALLGEWLSSLIQTPLPHPGLMGLWSAIGTTAILLLGFALPPMLSLGQVPPLRVLRHDLAGPSQSALSVYGLGLGAFALLVWWRAQDPRLAAVMLGATLITLSLLGAGALLLLRLLRPLRQRGGGNWRYGLANILRHQQASASQMLALGLGLMALFLLALIRTDLIQLWQQRLPADTPSHFFINIQPHEQRDFRAALQQRGIDTPPLDPMVRGRWVRLNETPVTELRFENPRAQHFAQREFNLSWSAALPSANRIVAGRWWSETESAGHYLSVERRFAERLGIQLGDRLGFRIGGSSISAEVMNLREVEWDSFSTNFFVIASPGMLRDAPASYLTSVRVPEAQRAQLGDLIRAFPSVTLFEISAILRQAQQILERLSRGVELVFGFTLAAGLAVLFAAIQTTQQERYQEAALLRSLGATRRQVRLSLLSEFGVIGLLAGLLGAIAAQGVAIVFAQRMLDLPYTGNAWIWLIGPAGGALGVALAGLWGTRRVVTTPPLQTLRQG